MKDVVVTLNKYERDNLASALEAIRVGAAPHLNSGDWVYMVLSKLTDGKKYDPEQYNPNMQPTDYMRAVKP